MIIVQIILSLLLITHVYLLGYKDKQKLAWGIGFIYQYSFFVFLFFTGQYGLLLAATILLFIVTRNFKRAWQDYE